MFGRIGNSRTHANRPARALARVLTATLSCLLAGFTQLGCSVENPTPDREIIVVSVPPLAYFAKRIAGESFEISTLVPPGTDPHHFEPSMSQLLDLNRAVLYLEIGHPRLEFETLLRRRHLGDYPELPVLRLSESLEMMANDPHVWTSPRAARTIAEVIAARLFKLAPNDAGMESRLEELLTDIDAVDERLRRWSEDPGATRTFIAHHPAWGYLARDYGLQQTAIHLDHAEPSAARLARIIERSRREEVRIIVVQPGYSVESARTVAEEIGAEVVAIDPLGSNWISELNELADAFIAADAARPPRASGTP